MGLLMVAMVPANLMFAIKAEAGDNMVLQATAPITFWGIMGLALTAGTETLFGTVA